MSPRTTTTLTYTTVPGYFLQDDPSTIAEDFDFISNDFGLINRDYIPDLPQRRASETQWQRFEREVRRLNAEAGEGVCYKVLYLGRHGQGVHNVAEQRYGREEWDRYYASLQGDSHGPWSDAHLTKTGIQQALSLHEFWKRQLGEAKIPAPEKYYTTPLYRCLETANLTFEKLELPADRPYEPIVKELLREANGVHTCDRRSSLSLLRSSFTNFTFERGFAEEDELWSASQRETDGELDERMKELLDDVFSNDGSTFLSFTSHSGAICSLLRVLGHREFRLITGGVIPVLARAESVVK
ncbi:MAG: hypothetical protein L6R41_002734 [Letrouitia leprolyta]|nr:MAG: hypothetical protein L6R41_002734 [Letrouitia leprolyta]